MVLIFLVTKLFQKGTMFNWVTVIIGIGFNGAETNCNYCTHFRHPTDEQLGHVDIFFSNHYNLQSVYFELFNFHMRCYINAMVSKMPDGLNVQSPPPPGKLAAQSPFGDSCYHIFITCSIYRRMYVDVQGGKWESSKFQFDISLIFPHAQSNGTFRLHRPNPSHSMLLFL